MVTWNVHVDISKDTVDGKNGVYKSGSKYYYKGSCRCTITLRKEVEPKIKIDENKEQKEKLENYKLYYHKIPDNWEWWFIYYQLKKVEHNGVAQTGLDGMGSLSTYREVCVIYWLRDEYNSFPLIIGLGDDRFNYFKRKEYSNAWESAGITHPADLSDYNKVLCELNNGLKSIVIVNLNAKKDDKYCGHPSVKQTGSLQTSCEEKHKFPTVRVECNSQYHKGFDKHTHKFSDSSSMRVLSATYGTTTYSFGKRDINTQYKNVNVYYSSTDSDKKNPLIIELVPLNGTKEYYTFDGKLARNHSINENNILKYLDEQNCIKNNIVVADLSNKRGRYCCGMNGHRKIQVEQHSKNVPNGYTSYLHLQTKDENNFSFNVNRFKDGEEHIWPGPINSIKSVHAYFCNKDTSRALLIYVNKGSGSAWFRRTSGDGNTWTETGLNSLQSQTPNSPSITDSIKQELRNICDDLKIECQHRASASPGAGGSGTGSGSTDVGSGGSGSSSSIVDPSSSQQQGTGGPPGPGRGNPDNTDGNSGDSPPSGPKGEPGGGHSSGAGQKDVGQKILKFIESHPAEIAGGTIGTGILGVVAWKLWSKIISFIITRL